MIRSKRIQLLITNITIYLFLFSIFSFAIYKYVERNQFESVNKELIHAKEILTVFKLEKGKGEKEEKAKLNPRLAIIIRDSKGDIITNLGSNDFLRDSDEEIVGTELDKLTDITVGRYIFRSLSFKSEAIIEHGTVQVLFIINPEKELMHNLLTILIFGGCFMILLSVGASWYLTQKSMESIVKSWKKQREFVENASHELRTPLTIIQSKLEILLKEPNAKIINKLEYLSLALSETRRISRMVGNLLTLARADSNSTELEKEVVNVRELISEVIEPYKEIGEIEEKRVSFSCNGNETLLCDKGRIHQLLVILLDNALKYTEENGDIKVIASSKDNKFVISVEDNGIGIKEENRHKVFERFFREDTSRTRETGGSGLGLSIAAWIVEQHGGNIKCFQNKPKGTIMKVTLPIKNVKIKRST